MFERFTDRARRVVVIAQDDARELGHAAILPDHILLALAEEGTGVASRAMASVGVDPVALRARVASASDVTQERRHAARLPFNPRAKKVLELSLREALQLGHSYIGTEHLLLAVLRSASGDGATGDDVCGVPVNRLRKAVLAAMAVAPHTERFSPALGRAVQAGRSLAGPDATTTGQLLMAMLDDPQSQAARALAALGANREAVAQAIAEVPVDQTSDASPDALVELRVADRTLRIVDAALAAGLSAATTDQVLGALRRLSRELSGDATPE